MTYEWDDGNVRHLALHGVTPTEAEQAMENDPIYIEAQEDDIDGERHKLIGETDAGRIMMIVMTFNGSRIRVITAWDAVRADRITYLERRADQWTQNS